MPFNQKTLNDLISEMVANMAANSSVRDFNVGSVIRTIFESLALPLDEAYYQLINLSNAFYVTTASGTDLDKRASDFGLTRKEDLASSVLLSFSQAAGASTAGNLIPSGTKAQKDAVGEESAVVFTTTADTTVGGSPISATCDTTGLSGNVAASTITTMVSSISGVDVTNAAAASGGQDQESDADFRTRIRAYFQSLSRSTPDSLRYAALSVDNVKVVLLKERYSITGGTELVDPGAVLNSSQDGCVVVLVDDGKGSLPEAQRDAVVTVIEGDVNDPVNYPGYRAAGIQVFVSRPLSTDVDVSATITAEDFVIDVSELRTQVSDAISAYISDLTIEAPVYLSGLVTAAKNVYGVANVVVTSPTSDVASIAGTKYVPGTITIS